MDSWQHKRSYEALLRELWEVIKKTKKKKKGSSGSQGGCQDVDGRTMMVLLLLEDWRQGLPAAIASIIYLQPSTSPVGPHDIGVSLLSVTEVPEKYPSVFENFKLQALQ